MHEHNTEAAREALLDADGAVLVLAADAPISEQERDLLRLLAERRAPTFFVLNKVDHLRPAEVDEVRRFVEHVLCDELGRKPLLFPVSARAALEPTVGRPELPAMFGEFVAELERFIQEDLVKARLDRGRAASLSRLGASLRDALAVETAALDLDAETLAAKVDRVPCRGPCPTQAFDDDQTLLGRDVARLSDEVSRRLFDFARAEPAQHTQRPRGGCRERTERGR